MGRKAVIVTLDVPVAHPAQRRISGDDGGGGSWSGREDGATERAPDRHVRRASQCT